MPAIPPTCAAAPGMVGATPEALERATAASARLAARHRARRLADVAYTLQTGRSVFACRRTLVCRQRGGRLRGARTRRDESPQQDLTFDGVSRGVAFVFPELESPITRAMAAGLYESEPIFRDAFDRCRASSGRSTGDDLRHVFRGSPRAALTVAPGHDRVGAAGAVRDRVRIARLWIGWGVRPAAMLGHGVGEYRRGLPGRCFPAR